jgi:hypothetical protein
LEATLSAADAFGRRLTESELVFDTKRVKVDLPQSGLQVDDVIPGVV